MQGLLRLANQHRVSLVPYGGGSGLMGVVFHQTSPKAMAALIDGMKLFALGFSWGGYESLVLPFDCAPYRTATRWAPEGPALRFSIGAEYLKAGDAASAALQLRVVQALGRVLPADCILYTPEDTTPYECDGLTAYRERPLVVALPETEAQVQAVVAAIGRDPSIAAALIKYSNSVVYAGLREVTDLVGVRVITYLTSDIERVEQAFDEFKTALTTNPRLKVISAAGDGDTFAIGVENFVHICRRDPELLHIIMDNGVFVFGGHRFRAPEDEQGGPMDMRRAIIKSSNVYFYSLANDLGVDLIHDEMEANY